MLKLDRQHVVRLERTQHAGDKRLRPCRTTGRFVSRTRTQVDCSQTRRSTPISSPRLPKGIVAPTRSSLRRSTRSPLRALCHRLRGLVQMRWPSYSSALHFSSPMLPSCSPATAGARASQQVNLVLMRDGHVRDTVVREVHMVSLSRLHSRCFRDAWESRCELLVRVQIIEIDHGRPASSSSPFGRPSPASQLFRFVGRTRGRGSVSRRGASHYHSSYPRSKVCRLPHRPRNIAPSSFCCSACSPAPLYIPVMLLLLQEQGQGRGPHHQWHCRALS